MLLQLGQLLHEWHLNQPAARQDVLGHHLPHYNILVLGTGDYHVIGTAGDGGPGHIVYCGSVTVLELSIQSETLLGFTLAIYL